MEERENSAKEKVEMLAENLENQKAEQRVANALAKKEKQQHKKNLKMQAKNKKQQQKHTKDLIKQEKQKIAKEKREQKKQELDMFIAEKIKLKREKQLQKAQLKQQKAENRAIAKADKRAKRERRRAQRSSRGVGGWIAAVVSLGLATLIFATLFVVNSYGGLKNFPQTMVAQNYSQCYDEFALYSQNIDTNLSKFFVSNSKGEQQRLLIKVTEDSLLAEENLQRLPLQASAKHSTTKVVNQIGDYSKYLNNKLIDGLSITKKERQDLYRLYEYNKNILNGLQEISTEIKNGAKIENIFKDENIGNQVFTKLEDMAVSYPELIYDGPFSDGLRNKKAKGLSGEEITESQAEKIFKAIFADYNLNQHQVVGEFNGIINCYSLNAKDEFGNDLYAQISKQGGKLIMFDYQKVCEENQEKLSQDKCQEIGVKFLKDLGIKNMQAVWCEDNGEMVTLNFAYKQQGVIVYPDLIKLNICKNTGVVFGLEGTSYYLNHTNRDIASAKINSEQALNSVNQDFMVEEIRLALIPKGNDKEVLTYEISGENQDGYYFVYINATNGQEEQIFKVIDTEQGQLLI